MAFENEITGHLCWLSGAGIAARQLCLLFCGEGTRNDVTHFVPSIGNGCVMNAALVLWVADRVSPTGKTMSNLVPLKCIFNVRECRKKRSEPEPYDTPSLL